MVGRVRRHKGPAHGSDWSVSRIARPPADGMIMLTEDLPVLLSPTSSGVKRRRQFGAAPFAA